MDEYNNLLTYNHIFLNRTRRRRAHRCADHLPEGFGATGPILRGPPGFGRDLRKDMPVLERTRTSTSTSCPSAPFEQAWSAIRGTRHRQRLLEIDESLKIIRQAVAKLPEGDIAHKKVTRGWKAPPGEAYVASEAPRGEISAATSSRTAARNPYRCRMRGPSFFNISLMTDTSRGPPDRRPDRADRLDRHHARGGATGDRRRHAAGSHHIPPFRQLESRWLIGSASRRPGRFHAVGMLVVATAVLIARHHAGRTRPASTSSASSRAACRTAAARTASVRTASSSPSPTASSCSAKEDIVRRGADEAHLPVRALHRLPRGVRRLRRHPVRARHRRGRTSMSASSSFPRA